MGDRAALEIRITGVRKGQYDVEIVQAVRARKVLYDKSHEHHKNPRVKEVEWQRIADELQVPPTCVIKRWTVIRERFASEKRKVQALGPSSWWLMSHMEWLDVHIQPRQRGKFEPIIAGLPNLTHISALGNFKQENYSFHGGNNSDYLKIEDEDDSRSMSPIMSIAYPEVCMRNISSDEEGSNYNQSNHLDTNDNDKGKRSRRSTHVSDDSSHGPLVMGLDLDEAAAARAMAALRTVEDPVLRHKYRQRLHQFAEECELAGLQNGNLTKRRKEV